MTGVGAAPGTTVYTCGGVTRAGVAPGNGAYTP